MTRDEAIAILLKVASGWEPATLDEAMALIKACEIVGERPIVIPIKMLDHANIIDTFAKIVQRDVRAEATVGQQLQARLCLYELAKNGSGYARFVLENILKVKDWNDAVS